jgi:predicted DNA-binding transcriptional regulator AlpA
MQPEFITVAELAKLTGFSPKTIYNWWSSKTGPLATILVKFGDRLGCWRADYETFRDQQRKLKPPAAPEQQSAA